MGQRSAETVLVIDDDEEILAAINETLRDEGYRVLAAANGTQALALLESERVDLILLDLLMPKMSGWELLEQNGRDHRLGTTPIILISAAPEDCVLDKNVRAVLQKPFDRGALLDAVAT